MTLEKLLQGLRGLGFDLVPTVDHIEKKRRFSEQVTGGPDHSKRYSVSCDEALILARWADRKRVLEIGTGLGVSTTGLALSATEVVTVDPDAWVLSTLRFPLHVKQVATVSQVHGSFDLAFIDGLHDKQSVMHDIQVSLLHVRPGGRFAFHDTKMEGVAQAIEQFPLTPIEICQTAGALSLWRRNEDE